MDKFQIYEDIRARTNGDIYVGVVGPVRVGKSTFITNFMKKLVMPNIQNKYSKERTLDELPQSAEGRTIMTTQPKFIPNEAVKISVADGLELKVRFIDCVGYMVEGAMGHEEDGLPRLVRTPWSEVEMPFEEAAEIGTRKVIEEHSTIGLVLTTDGSITDIPRTSYITAEERVVKEMKAKGKPFVMILNSKNPEGADAKKLAEALNEKYSVPVISMSALDMQDSDIDNVFEKLLYEFPIKSVKVNMPAWLQALPFENGIIANVVSEIMGLANGISKLSQFDKTRVVFAENENFEAISASKIQLSDGTVMFDVLPKPDLFYKVLSEECGMHITNDYELVSQIKELAVAKREYEKMKVALAQVEECGYGIVTPSRDDMVLDEPEIIKQGGRHGVKLKASAKSLHIMRVDLETEVTPLVGTEEQTTELAKYIMDRFSTDKESVWETNMFGRNLYSLVADSMNGKVVAMPAEAQRKMRKTLGRIVNEGKGGIICILL